MSKGLSSVKTLSAKEIAKKWNLPLSVVAKKIAAGVKVEKEHTKSTKQANEIARDHLGERPDYYDKLGKMEKQPVVKENTSVAGVAGLGINTGVPAIDDDNSYVSTNALARDPMNGAIMDFINKHHHRLHDKTSFKQYDAKKLKTSSNKDLAESLGSDYGTSAVPVVGDLTGTPRKVTKVDEVKLPPKARKAIATGMTLANLYTAGDVASRAQQGIGSPAKDMVTAASTLSGTKGWTAYGADKARQAYEYIKGKRMKENKNLVPANTVERGIYEATFQGKTVPLNKPMKGDVKKSKVYVDPDGDGKAQKVNFGDPNMTIKKSNPARRKSFRARHNCDNPGPKTKARYWSCRAWEETELFETTLKKKIKYAIKAAGQQSRIAKELRPNEVESDKTYQKRKKGLDRVFKEEQEYKKLSYDDFTKGRIDLKNATPEQHREMGRRAKKAGVGGSQWHFKKAKEKEKPVKESKDVPYNHGRGKPGVGETPVASRADGSGTYYKLARGYDGRSTHHVIYTKKDETVQSKTEKSALKKLDKLEEVTKKKTPKEDTVTGIYMISHWRQKGPREYHVKTKSGKTYVHKGPKHPKVGDKVRLEETKKTQGYQNWPGEKKKKFFSGPKDANGKTETQKWAERRQKERESKKEKLDENPMAMAGELAMAKFLTPPRMVSGLLGDKISGEADRDKEIKDLKTNINHQRKLDSIKNVADWSNNYQVAQMNEISAELVGKVSNARYKQGKAPSKTLSRAINKKFVELQLKKEKETGVPFEGSHKRSHEKSSTHVHRLAMQGLKAQLKEETTMDTKDLINEALDNILEDNLVAMKDNLQTALQEKMMEKLEERKKIIASDYFAQ